MAGTTGHFQRHFAGIAVGHAGDEVDHAQERGVQRAIGIGRVVAQKVENTAALERWRAPVVLLQRSAAEGIEEDFQGGVGADFMQRLALVLENFLAGHVFRVQYAALGRAVHVLHQIAGQPAGEQCVLLFDEGTGGGIGQVLDGLASQNRQFSPA